MSALNCTPKEMDEYLSNLKDGYVPCQNLELSICSQALGEGCSPTCSSDISQSEQLKSIPIASKSCQRGRKTVSFRGFPSLMMSSNSTVDHGEGLSILSPAVFPARISHVLERAKVLGDQDLDFGEKWRESSMRYDRDTLSWKTHRSLWDEVLPESSVTLPKWGMMLSGVVYQRRTSERPIGGTGSGWLPTPLASSYGSNRSYGSNQGGGSVRRGKVRHSLETMARKGMWPTPQSHDAIKGNAARVGRFGTKHGGRNLNDEVDKWPTPTVQDGNGRTHHNQRDGSKTYSLLGIVQRFPTPTKSDGTGGPGRSSKRIGGDNLRTHVGGMLNPDWVELLMGWPKGWTDLGSIGKLMDYWYLWGADWERDTPRVSSGQLNRTARLRAIGNGQVPVCAAIAWLILSGMANSV